MLRIRRNLLAGVVGSGMTAALGLLVVPLYLKYLGIEAYGLIGFFITTQALLQLLDMGLAPTVNRELARCAATDAMPEGRTLFRTLEVISWLTAGFIALAAIPASELISRFWLQSRALDAQTVRHALLLMGLVIALRWPNAIYQAALIGMHRLDIATSVTVLCTMLGACGAVAILALVSPTIEAFFMWQMVVAVASFLMMRRFAWRLIGRDERTHFSTAALRRIWRFTAGLSGVAVTALILTQLDKLLLSRLLPLSEFGHYMLATVVAGGFSMVLFTPAFNVAYPLFSRLVAMSDGVALERAYRLGTKMLVTVLFPLVMLLVLVAEDLLHLWTGNLATARSVAPILALLSLGAGVHGIMYLPYALQLASGAARLPLLINCILVTLMVPMIGFLATAYGSIGGALAWLLVNVAYVALGTWLTHRRLLRGIGARWLLQDVGIAAAATCAIGTVSHLLLISTQVSMPARVSWALASAVLAGVALIAISPTLRGECRRRLFRQHSSVAA